MHHILDTKNILMLFIASQGLETGLDFQTNQVPFSCEYLKKMDIHS